MRNKKLTWFGMVFLVVVLSTLFLVSAESYISSNPNYGLFNSYVNIDNSFTTDECEAGQDFILQIAPFGCTPAVVRSDLLEEQNVPVFCKVAATKINPLIGVEAIEGISFSGQYPPEISGVGFHPSRAALGVRGDVNSPILDNIGYAVIVLRKQEKEADMPEFVSGNLTARLKYDLKNAFGIGQATFYLPQMSGADFEDKKVQYSFWDGRGYLKAEEIGVNEAAISIYNDIEKLSTIRLKKGESSNEIYIPGFECRASLKLRLDDLAKPDTRARFDINGEKFEVAKGEKFLDNKCEVTSVPKKNGLSEIVTIKCNEDESGGFFGTSHDLEIRPRVKISIHGAEGGCANTEEGCEVGDILYKDNNGKKIFLGHVGEYQGKKFVIPVASNSIDKEKFLSSFNFIVLNNYAEVLKKALGGEFDVLGNKVLTGQIVELLAKGDDIGTAMIIEGNVQGISFLGSKFKEKLLDKGLTVGLKDPITPILKTAFSFYSKETIDKLVPDYGAYSMQFLGFAGPVDAEIPKESKTNYEKALADYETVIKSFGNEKYKEILVDGEKYIITYGEEALIEKINLARDTQQNKKMKEFCDEFEKKYSNSEYSQAKSVLSDCNNLLKLSSSTSATYDASINGKVKRITFEGIYEPSKEEYSAVVRVSGSDKWDGVQTLGKNEKAGIPAQWFELIELGDDYAIINGPKVSSSNGIQTWSNHKIEKGKSGIVLGRSNYEVRLVEINLKKSAKVSVVPNINDVATAANFSFKIGIEKRAIQLSPEKTREKIKNLDEKIKDLEEKSENLGNVVKGLKGACFATEAFFAAKNFVNNLDGTAIARKEVMRNKGGWYDKCTESIQKKEYANYNECFAKNSDNIDKAVNAKSKIIKSQNEKFKKLQDDASITTKKWLGTERVVNDDEIWKKHGEGMVSDLKNSLNKCYPSGKIKIGTEEKSIDEFVNYQRMNKSSMTILGLRDLQTEAEFCSAGYDMAKGTLDKSLGDFYVNTQGGVEKASLQEDLKKVGTNLVGGSYGGKDSIQGYYYGGKITINKIVGLSDGHGLDSKTTYPAEINYYAGTPYLFIYRESTGGTYNAIKVYKFEREEGGNIKIGAEDTTIANNFKSFMKADASTYSNPYESSIGETVPTVRYHETTPNVRLPAVVPFDLKEGWYVSTSNSLGSVVSDELKAYDDSGVVKNYYICNVGANKREENKRGDDICRGVNQGTGQPIGLFPGLDTTKASKLVGCAQKAIRDASDAYKSGIVGGEIKINSDCDSFKVKVGNPAADVPDMQCQDFMSPDDCKVLFNVCDPVICPSSRCNLGGSYPVKDVIQSGIIGSIALCLPNFGNPNNGGVIIPVCLTGIKAGLDGLLSVYHSYRDCLQESLDTGKTIGICDEIHSIYMCEFMWKQGLPIANMIIPKLLEIIKGQNVLGGGEYLGVASAWGTASKSIDYFTSYYAQNSFAAFKARTTEEAGGEICRNFASGVYPEGGNILDRLTEPDSPPQFHGRFDEIPFTTATVPPISHYKVYYHIFAGKDSRAYYQVYLKGAKGSSYYQDASYNNIVASGYIATGGYASETKDFTAPSGYKEMCIRVNNQEECGFQQASTSYAVNYVNDKYMEEIAMGKGVTSEKECVSGSASLYSAINPNLQSGADEIISPQIYDRGIIRICATESPGKGTDGKDGTADSRWVQVGNCGNQNIKCWLDKQSVSNVIKDLQIENNTLSKLSENQLEILKKEGNYVSLNDNKKDITKLNGLEKINKITEMIGKVLYNSEKAWLFLERGNAYGQLAKAAKKIIDDAKAAEEAAKTLSEVSKLYDEISEGQAATGEGTTGSSDRSNVNYNFNSVRTQKQITDALGGPNTQDLCNNYAKIFAEKGNEYRIDPLLLVAMVKAESTCNVNAIGDDGKSFGLMQIYSWEICKDKLGLKNIEGIKGTGNVEKNIECGAIILKQRYEKYKNGLKFTGACEERNKEITYYEWEAALRGYNGLGCVEWSDGNSDGYVKKVMDEYLALSGQGPGQFPEETPSVSTGTAGAGASTTKSTDIDLNEGLVIIFSSKDLPDQASFQVSPPIPPIIENLYNSNFEDLKDLKLDIYYNGELQKTIEGRKLENGELLKIVNKIQEEQSATGAESQAKLSPKDAARRLYSSIFDALTEDEKNLVWNADECSDCHKLFDGVSCEQYICSVIGAKLILGDKNGCKYTRAVGYFCLEEK